MKRWGKLLACAMLALAAVHAAAAPHAASAAAGKIGIMLDGYPLPFAAEPVVENGTTLVPFRSISEALGVNVVWDAEHKSITATKDTKQIVLKLGDKKAWVNGKEELLAVAPRSAGGHTLIPISFFSRQFGAIVEWNGAAKTVTIVSPKEPMYTLGFYAISSFSERSYISKFDSVAFGWSRLDAGGSFTLEGNDFKWPQPAGDYTPERLVEDTYANGSTPYLMVFSGDANLELSGVLADKEKQENLINQVIQAATDNGFKGVLLDFEGLGLTGDKTTVRAEYNAFVKNAADRAKQSGLKLAIAVHPLNGPYKGYDYAALGNLADELIIMAYAYEDEKSPEPDNKVDEAIRLALKETAKEKLVLGISLASENVNSVHVKTGLAKRYGLKGIAIWRLGLIGSDAMSQMESSIEFGRMK
ncbi:stalk domain-containing protein [Paenibacillus alkalitolerans]|uniref:stalk domain-containing protein n=1 Tax=Paenibacillus alkalitolerans TaxID=2799335 RepID=UPI0018F6FB52|nr:stalk domain-containing protein [Paenibacillus alkalitolerans]